MVHIFENEIVKLWSYSKKGTIYFNTIQSYLKTSSLNIIVIIISLNVWFDTKIGNVLYSQGKNMYGNIYNVMYSIVKARTYTEIYRMLCTL